MRKNIFIILVLFFTTFIFFGISVSAEETTTQIDINKKLDEENRENQNDTAIENISGGSIVTESDNEIISEADSITSVLPPDTTVVGNLFWQDAMEINHPLRFTKIKVIRTDTLIDRILYEGLTNINGEFSFTFANDLLDGKCNLSIVVYAQGDDIEVCNSNGEIYSCTINGDDYDKLNNISSGDCDLGECLIPSNSIFWQAIQIAQSAIFASIYYEEMKGSDVDNVEIIYPHNENNIGCFYRWDEKRIYVIGPDDSHVGSIESFESCDVIAHEYGHHIAHCENLVESIGGWHSGDMAEHYKLHFVSNITHDSNNGCMLSNINSSGENFTEAECKRKGCQIAWSEGVATFFGELAQQYFLNVYISLSSFTQKPHDTFADATYTAYNLNRDIEIEEIDVPRVESNESIVTNILFDIFDDSSDELFDVLAFGHQKIWGCLKNSNATTLYEFIEFLRTDDNYKDSSNSLGEILYTYRLAPTIESFTITPSELSIHFIFLENNSTYFQARKFKVNFYDSSMNFLTSTEGTVTSITTARRIITVSGELFEEIVNYGPEFYFSITAYECDGNINNYGNADYYTTGYESSFSVSSISDIYEILEFGEEVTGNFNESTCNWYRFIAPYTDEFVFETTGSTDTYGEVFISFVFGESDDGRLIYDDNSGELNNFKLAIYLEYTDIILIRVRKSDFSGGGTYTLSVSTPNHVHNYTKNYKFAGNYYHRAFCVCGDSALLPHEFISTLTGNNCKFCGYFKEIVPVIKQSLPPQDIDKNKKTIYSEDETE